MNCDRCGLEIVEDYRAPWAFDELEGAFCSPACHHKNRATEEEIVEKFADVVESAAGIAKVREKLRKLEEYIV